MSIAQLEAREVQLEAPSGLWADAWSRLRRNPGAIVGFVLVGIFVFVAIFAPLLAPYDPREQLGLANSFDGPSRDHLLGLDELAALPAEDWARVGLEFQPSCQRLRLQHNTLAIWQAIDQDGTPPQASRLDQPTELLVWRRGLQPHFRSLGPLEAGAIDRLLTGDGFAATCTALVAEFPDAPIVNETGALLRRWIEEELLSGLVARA